MQSHYIDLAMGKGRGTEDKVKQVSGTNSYGTRYHVTTQVYYSTYSLWNALVGTVVHAMQSVGTKKLTLHVSCHLPLPHIPTTIDDQRHKASLDS